jgi:2-dehydro-3-deoxy-L-rhamnonate dehydrogenase (NAD+)
MPSYELDGRVAFVTGAGRGIGAACARLLAASGARVAVTDIDGASAEETAEQIAASGGEAAAYALDVTDPERVDAVADEVAERWGGLHVGVNNAGMTGDAAAVADLSTDGWRRVLALNLDAVFFCTRAEARHMRAGGGGSIVNLASILSNAAFPAYAPYAASKHGVVGLPRAAARDHAGDGIRINAVGPGFIDTPLNDVHSEETKQAITAAIPLGRWGAADEVAQLVVWLASDAASYATGSYFPIDGAYLAQ